MGNLAENKYRAAFGHDVLMVMRELGMVAKLDRDGSEIAIRVHLGHRSRDCFRLFVPQRGEAFPIRRGTWVLPPVDARLGDDCPICVAKGFAASIAMAVAGSN